MFNHPQQRQQQVVDPRSMSPQQQINVDLGEIRVFWGVIRDFSDDGESHVILSGMPLLSGMMSLQSPITKTFCDMRFDPQKAGLVMGSGSMTERVNDITCETCQELINRLLRQVMEQ